MNILIFTYSVTRTAGGVFDAVRELFTNTAFKQEELKIISYQDEYCDEDLSAWNNLPIKLFTPGFMLYSAEAKKLSFLQKQIFYIWKHYGVAHIAGWSIGKSKIKQTYSLFSTWYA